MQHYAQITYFQPIDVVGVPQKIYAIITTLFTEWTTVKTMMVLRVSNWYDTNRKHGADMFSQKACTASNPEQCPYSSLPSFSNEFGQTLNKLQMKYVQYKYVKKKKKKSHRFHVELWKKTIHTSCSVIEAMTAVQLVAAPQTTLWAHQ